MSGVEQLRTFPSSDRAFQRAAERAAEGAASPTDLAVRLRSAYPRVTVRERALSYEPSVLYVYRDGRFAPPREAGWWTASGIATARLSVATGRFLAANEHWGEMLGGTRDDVIGRHYAEFVLGDAEAAAAAIFDAIRDDHDVSTDILVRRRDGTTLLVEVRAARDGDEIELAYRLSPAERRRRPRRAE